MKRCDICGKDVKVSYDLIELKDCYKTDNVKDVCPECDDMLRDKNSNLQSMVAKIIEAGLDSFIKAQRRKQHPEVGE